jgi:hypothetical protein
VKNSTIRFSTILAVLSVVTLLAVGAPPAVHSQTTGLRVAIPFEFTVGSQLLPPGIYSVWLRGGSMISISDGRGQSAASQSNGARRSVSSSTPGSLVFTMYGNRAFLTEVRWEGYSDSRTLLKSKTEIEYARSLQDPTATVATIVTR